MGIDIIKAALRRLRALVAAQPRLPLVQASGSRPVAAQRAAPVRDLALPGVCYDPDAIAGGWHNRPGETLWGPVMDGPKTSGVWATIVFRRGAVAGGGLGGQASALGHDAWTSKKAVARDERAQNPYQALKPSR